MDVSRMIPPKPYLKTSDVAKVFNVDHSTVFLWVKKGKLHPITTPGGNLRFSRKEIVSLFTDSQYVVKGASEVDEKRKYKRFPIQCPVIARIGQGWKAFAYNAVLEDISNRGSRILVYDNNGLEEMLEKKELKRVTVLNQSNALLKEIVSGEVSNFRTVGPKKIEIGIVVKAA